MISRAGLRPLTDFTMRPDPNAGKIWLRRLLETGMADKSLSNDSKVLLWHLTNIGWRLAVPEVEEIPLPWTKIAPWLRRDKKACYRARTQLVNARYVTESEFRGCPATCRYTLNRQLVQKGATTGDKKGQLVGSNGDKQKGQKGEPPYNRVPNGTQKRGVRGDSSPLQPVSSEAVLAEIAKFKAGYGGGE